MRICGKAASDNHFFGRFPKHSRKDASLGDIITLPSRLSAIARRDDR
jgi:hypothetical protein